MTASRTSRLKGLLLLAVSVTVLAGEPQHDDPHSPGATQEQAGYGYSLAEILERLGEIETPATLAAGSEGPLQATPSAARPSAESATNPTPDPAPVPEIPSSQSSLSDVDAIAASAEGPQAQDAVALPAQRHQNATSAASAQSGQPGPEASAAPSVAREAIAESTAPAPVDPVERPASLSPITETGTLSGRIRFSAGDRPLRASEASNAIVYFRPAVAVAVEPLSEEQVMATRRKQFVPRALPITPGSRVRFPNNDPILHNTFSTVPGNEFDTGLYGQGDGVAHTFQTTGHVRVYCNVHHSMIGHVLVLDTPFFANPDATGAFRLTDVPLGEGELFVWHERSSLWRQSIDPANGAMLEIDIELSTRRVPPHSNKFGQPYRRRGDSEY